MSVAFDQEMAELAEKSHARIQADLNAQPVPWWEVMDQYDALGDEVSCFYTQEMKTKDWNHPNVFLGSSQDWAAQTG